VKDTGMRKVPPQILSSFLLDIRCTVSHNGVVMAEDTKQGTGMKLRSAT